MSKITAIKLQKRNRDRVNIYIDDQFAFGLARIVAGWLQVGQELSDEKIASLQAEDAQEAAYQYALNYIGYRERSEAEIIKHLKDHQVVEEVIQLTLQRLKRSGLQSDNRFARGWVENRSDFRPRSRRALVYELRQKGINEKAIEQAISELDDDELAYRAANKQMRKLDKLEWPEFRQKMYAFLARRGFNYETAAEAAARVWAERSEHEQSDQKITNEEVDA